MTRPIALSGKARRSFERKATLWGLERLWRELSKQPRTAGPKLRAFVATGRRSRIYMSALKPIQFGPCVKMGLYLPHWPGEALEARFRRALHCDGRHPHEQVMLSVTDACPYKCPHCFNDRRSQRPMAFRRLRELVGEIQAVGGSWICIHGGEPLVDFDRTMAVVEAADDRSEVWLATTGLGLDAPAAEQLKQAGLFGACVSIHHHTPAEHDAFVGYPGAFRIAVEAVEHFHRAGVFVAINTALTRQRVNADQFQRMMDLARDLGAGMVEVLFIRPAGRAVVGCDQMLPTAGDRTVLEAAMRKFNRSRDFQDYPLLVSPVYFETPQRFGCVAGNERIFISAAGDLQPCAMVSLSVGSVARESFSAVAGRLRALLPRPRSDLLCTQLQAVIAEKTDSAACAELPLAAPLSREILRGLPASPPPQAFAH